MHGNGGLEPPVQNNGDNKGGGNTSGEGGSEPKGPVPTRQGEEESRQEEGKHKLDPHNHRNPPHTPTLPGPRVHPPEHARESLSLGLARESCPQPPPTRDFVGPAR